MVIQTSPIVTNVTPLHRIMESVRKCFVGVNQVNVVYGYGVELVPLVGGPGVP